MNKKVLIADDETSLREMYKERLSHESFDVIFAKDGEEALELIYRERPYLALLDIMMPNKTGMEVLEEVKKDPKISNTIIGMLTVLDDDNTKEKAFDLGAKYYLIKSQVMPADVIKIIKNEISEV